MLRLALYLFLLFPTLIVGTVLRAWVLRELWNWFVAPTFNIPAPSLLQCFGLMLIFGLLTGDPGVKLEKMQSSRENVRFNPSDPVHRQLMEIAAEKIGYSVRDTLAAILLRPTAIFLLGWTLHLLQ